MALREELARNGAWLFRWRSYLPLGMLAIFLLALRGYEHPAQGDAVERLWLGLCLVVGFLGLGVRAFTIGYTPKGTSGRNTKKQVADELNTTGLYSAVRNPLYLGNFLMGLGPALFPRLWWLTLIYILAFWLYYERIIFTEEEFLRGKFGGVFLAWAAATPVFLPKLSGYRAAGLPFSWRSVLRREYGGPVTIVGSLFLFETAGNFAAGRAFAIAPLWAVLLGVVCVVWISLWALKKHTRLLSDEDRD